MIKSLKDSNQPKSKEYRFCVLFQLWLGTLFVTYSVGLIIFQNLVMTVSHFDAVMMLVIITLSSPFAYWWGKKILFEKNAIWDKQKGDLRMGIIAFIAVSLFKRTSVHDHFLNFIEGNEGAGMFLSTLVILISVIPNKTIAIETVLFGTGLMLFHKFVPEINTLSIALFYLVMGGMLLIGGRKDFNKVITT